MQRAFVVLVCVFVSFAVSQNVTNFEGTWIDNFGFTHKICATDRGLEGTFSEFGLIQGDLSDNDESVNGNYYSTFYQNDRDCPSGTFSWHVNGNRIEGRYLCSDRLSKGNWTLDRIIPQVFPKPQECAALIDKVSQNNTLEGEWTYGSKITLDICISGDKFVASFGDTGTSGSGFQFGTVEENGRVLRGSYVKITDNYGTIEIGGTLTSLTQNRTITSYNWANPNSIARVNARVDGTFKTITGSTKISEVIEGACERNSYLGIGYEDNNNDEIVETTSGVVSLQSGFFFVAFIAVLAF